MSKHYRLCLVTVRMKVLQSGIVVRNRDRRPKPSERDRHTLKRTVSKNRINTAAKVTAELRIHLQDPVSTKTVRRELHKSDIHGTPAIAKSLIAENNTERRKRQYDDYDSWTSGDLKHVIRSGESSFTLFPTPGWVYVWRTRPKKRIILNGRFHLWNTEADLWWFGQQYIGILQVL